MNLSRCCLGIFLLVFLFAASIVEASLTDGLVLYLPFDEGQGEVAGDLSGNGHDGTLEGPEWTEGEFGNALSFDGVETFVEVPFSDDFVITEGITLGAWVAANVPFSPEWKGIINAQLSTYGPFLLQTGGDSKAEIGLYFGGAWTWLRSDQSLEEGVFHHVVGVYDQDEGLHIYFDGELDDGEGAFDAILGPIDEPPGESIAIGHNYGYEGRFWDGEIDEVVVYNRALSADEVAELFMKGIAVEGTLLQAGDADQDLDFDQLDLVKVQIAAKYLTGQAATWGEGDWNGAPGGSAGNPPQGDGLFDQIDIISALTNNLYLQGKYGALAVPAPPDGENDEQTSIVYDPGTGELAVNAPASTALTSINIDSAAGIFTGDPAQNLGGSFDNDADNNIFKATFGSSFGSLSFGNVAQAGLSAQFLLNDLTVVGSLEGGGDLGDVDLIYVPEPSAMLLLGMGLVGALVTQRRRRP